jgi:hypothetical protein
VIDVEHRDLVETRLDQRRQRLRGDLVAGFGEDFTGARVVEIGRDILAVQVTS